MSGRAEGERAWVSRPRRPPRVAVALAGRTSCSNTTVIPDQVPSSLGYVLGHLDQEGQRIEHLEVAHGRQLLLELRFGTLAGTQQA